MATAQEVAEYINGKHDVFGKMQLQKLVYYSQAWHLVWEGRPLFADRIEAWTDGPCTWAVHRMPSVTPAVAKKIADEVQLTDDEKATIDAVWDKYGSLTGTQLSVLTHSEAPWLDARGDTPRGANSAAPIPVGAMRRFYTPLADKAGAPRRVSELRSAETDLVLKIGRQQAERWREALDLLAR